MTKGTAVIRNSAGIHLRPTGVIIEAFGEYPGKIVLESHGMKTELQSALGLLALGLRKDDVVKVGVEGPRAKAVCAELIKLLEKEFDFPQKA